MTRKAILWKKQGTWDDLASVPESYIGEIKDGDIWAFPRPDMPHAMTTSGLGVLLGGRYQFGAGKPGDWIFLDEPHLLFGHELRVPDLAGWRRERWHGIRRQGPITLIPDWICEALSRSTASEDRGPKRDLYARMQVRHYWMIDPVAKTLEIYRLEGPSWLHVATHTGNEVVRAEPFGDLELDLSLLWRDAEEEDDED